MQPTTTEKRTHNNTPASPVFHSLFHLCVGSLNPLAIPLLIPVRLYIRVCGRTSPMGGSVLTQALRIVLLAAQQPSP